MSKTLTEKRMMELNFDQEMDFAREFYNKAIEGLDDWEEKPPFPDDWVEKDTDKILTDGWTETKVELIGLIEHEGTPEEQKKVLKEFLKCSLSVYMDLMCSISSTFLHSKDSKVEQVEEEVGILVGDE